MLDLSPLSNTAKSVLGLPPQAQPSVVEETKPVPESETRVAVPPLPSKGGGEVGLGGHMDLYDTQSALPEIIGKEARLPQPTTESPEIELPFLKPLVPLIGQAIDARV